MRRLGEGVLVCGCVAAACDGGRLDVIFVAPEAYRDRLVTASLEVLVPPESAPFDCDEVALGEVDAATQAASRVQGTTHLGPGSTALDGVPREGDKLFVVHAFDEAGVALAAGCAATGTIDGGVTVSVPGEPTKTVVVPPLPLGAPLPASLTLLVSDVAAATPLANVDVRWTVVGARGSIVEEGPQATDGRGMARLEPTPPALPGPALLDMRVRWEGTPRPPLQGFQPITSALDTLLPGAPADAARGVPPEALLQVGRVGPNGEPGIAALGPPDASAQRRALIAYCDAGAIGDVHTATSAPLPPSVRALGLVSAGARDRVVAMSLVQWLELDPDAQVTTRASPAPGRQAVRFFPAGGCSADTAWDPIVVLFEDGLGAFDAAGASTASPFVTGPAPGRLIGSGCVAATPGGVSRSLVFATGNLSVRLLTVVAGVVRSGDWEAAGAGIGFAPAGGDQGPRILGNRVDLEGLAITGGELVAVGPDRVDVVELASDDAPTLAVSTAGGDVDGDGTIDVVGLLDLGLGTDEAQARVYVSLGATYRGERIRGISPAFTLESARLALLDFDGDALDEVVLYGPNQVVVIRLQP